MRTFTKEQIYNAKVRNKTMPFFKYLLVFYLLNRLGSQCLWRSQCSIVINTFILFMVFCGERQLYVGFYYFIHHLKQFYIPFNKKFRLEIFINRPEFFF